MADNSSPDSKAIGGPKEGKYYILPAVAPKVIVGVDGVGEPTVPVVVDGKNNVFTVKKLENGNYTLTLEDSQPHQFIQDQDGRLVASVKPPASPWTISGNDCGPYTIGVPTCINWTQGWTLESDKPGSPIALTLLEVVFPEQLWNFVPWIGPEFK